MSRALTCTAVCGVSGWWAPGPLLIVGGTALGCDESLARTPNLSEQTSNPTPSSAGAAPTSSSSAGQGSEQTSAPSVSSTWEAERDPPAAPVSRPSADPSAPAGTSTGGERPFEPSTDGGLAPAASSMEAPVPSADAGPVHTTPTPASRSLRALVFSATRVFRHESLETAVAAVLALGTRREWSVRASEESGEFTDAALQQLDVVVFLNTTGDVLNDEQQAALQRFIQAGNGFVGVHAASDTEYDWPWYGELVGAYFKGHPDVQSALLQVEDTSHPATSHLPHEWQRADEWYGFLTNPRPNVQVLLSLDESSYSPGSGDMGGDHPIAWAHEFDGGRAFYTGLGHTAESYAEEAFLAHLAGGVEWAAGISRP